MKLRLVYKMENNLYYVQQRVGLIVKQWEYLNQYGLPLDYFHDYEDATPVTFVSVEDACTFIKLVSNKDFLGVYKLINKINTKSGTTINREVSGD